MIHSKKNKQQISSTSLPKKQEVSTNSFVNLMPVSNLAITIGPNILRRDNGLEEVKYVNEFVVFLVENFEGLFLPSKTFLFESIMAQDFQTVVGLMGVEEFDVNMIGFDF